MKKWILAAAVCVLLTGAALPAAAQDYYTNAFRTQVVSEHFSENNLDFHLTGFSLRYSRFPTRHVAFAGEYGASFGSPFNQDATNQWVVGGLQLYPVNTDGVQIYGQVLGGFDRLKFSSASFSQSDTSGAILVGGGLNLFPHPNVGINFEVDYKRTWLFDASQNIVQYRGGLTFRWGGY